jgi:hypothetical protein
VAGVHVGVFNLEIAQVIPLGVMSNPEVLSHPEVMPRLDDGIVVTVSIHCWLAVTGKTDINCSHKDENPAKKSYPLLNAWYINHFLSIFKMKLGRF